MKVEGEPARSASWWLKRSGFVRRYEKVGPFWLPSWERAVSEVRWFGTNILTVYHEKYQVLAREGNSEKTFARGADQQAGEGRGPAARE